MMSVIGTKKDEASTVRVTRGSIMEETEFSIYYVFLATKQIPLFYLNLLLYSSIEIISFVKYLK